MKSNFSKQMSLVMLLGLLTTGLMAQGYDRPNRSQGHPRSLKSELNLTVEQEAQMQKVREDHQEVMIDLRADHEKAQLQLRKLMREETPNKKKIHSQIEKVGSIELKMDKARIDHRLDMRQLLTAEQRNIFRQGMLERGPRGDCNIQKSHRKPRHRRF